MSWIAVKFYEDTYMLCSRHLGAISITYLNERNISCTFCHLMSSKKGKNNKYNHNNHNMGEKNVL